MSSFLDKLCQRSMTLGDGTKISYDIRNGRPEVRREENGSYSIFNANSATITGSKNGSNVNIYGGNNVTFNGTGDGRDNVSLFDCNGTKVNGNYGNDNITLRQNN